MHLCLLLSKPATTHSFNVNSLGYKPSLQDSEELRTDARNNLHVLYVCISVKHIHVLYVCISVKHIRKYLLEKLYSSIFIADLPHNVQPSHLHASLHIM